METYSPAVDRGGKKEARRALLVPLWTVLMIAGVFSSAQAQISITTLGTPVTENFDVLISTPENGLFSTMPTGWEFVESGTSATTTYRVGTGGTITGDTYSFGSTSSSDRALGGLRSGTLIPTFGARFTNNTGYAIGSLAIAYTGEQWRLGALNRSGDPADRIDFQYSLNATSLTTGTWVDVNGLDFASPSLASPLGSRNGNLAANRTARNSSFCLSIPAGATFWIRWVDFDAFSEDDGLSVDDFSLTARAIVLTETHTNVTAFGAGDGTIDLSVTGGSGPYTYSWSPSGQTTQDRSALGPGTYTVTVTDATGCTASLAVTITQPPSFYLTETHVNVLGCFGDLTGSINITRVGGVMPVSYLWSPGGATTEDLSGIAAGTYNVTATDANSIVATLSVTITQPPKLMLTETHANVSCNGAANGTINLTVSGGTTPYGYLWTPGGVSTEDRSGLGPGSHKVVVTDAHGCKDSLSVTIMEPPALVLTKTHVDVACHGDATGSIDLTVSGGTSPYGYLWTPGGATTQDRSGLVAGTYKVKVTDAQGCKDSVSVVVAEPLAALALSETHTDVSCFGAGDGAIDLTVTGGTSPYGYLWSPGGATTQDLSSLGPNTYAVTVTDAHGCVGHLSVTILEPPLLSVSETHVDVACYGDSTGSINLTVSGGTPGAMVQVAYTADNVVDAWWVDGGTSKPLGPNAGTWQVADVAMVSMGPGTHYVIFETENDETTEPTGPSNPAGFLAEVSGAGVTGALLSGVTWEWASAAGGVPGNFNSLTWNPVTTFGTNELLDPNPWAPVVGIADTARWIWTANGQTLGGEAHIFVRGQITVSPYSYAWSPGGETTEDLSGLAAGLYGVTVTDRNGCMKSLSVTIDEPLAALYLTNTSVDVACKGDSTGSIDLTVAGGTPGYTYLWSPNGETTEDLSNLVAGTYKVTVTDTLGCVDSLSVVISEPVQALTLGESHVDVLGCYGDLTGSIDLTVTGGTPGYTYLWSPGGEITEDLSSLAAGTYMVKVTDAIGCEDTLSVTIAQPDSLALTETHTDVSCFGAGDGAIGLGVTGGTGPYSYLWSPGGATTQDTSGLGPDTYKVVVTDANGCEDSLSLTIAEPLALAPTETHTDVTCNGASDGTIDLTVTGGTIPYTYLWSPGGETTADLSSLGPSTYKVIVTDKNGCKDSLSVTITEPDSLELTETHTDETCYGADDGAIDLTVTGGVTPYGYLWSPGGETTEDLTGLGPDTYTVTVTDDNGCTKRLSVTILEPPVLLASETHVDVACYGDSTGSIDVTVSGGTPGATAHVAYTADNVVAAWWVDGGVAIPQPLGPNAANLSQADVATLPLAPGTYQVIFEAENLGTFSAGNPAAFLAEITGTGVTGNLLSSVTWEWADATGGVPVDFNTLTWLPATSYGTNAPGDPNVWDPVAGIADAAEWIWTANNFAGGVESHIFLRGSIQKAPYSYVWSPGGETTEDLSNLAAGTYDVTVTDDNGCTKSLSVTIDQPLAALSLTKTQVDVACKGAATGSIDLTVAGGTPGYTYLWSPNGETTEDVSNLAAGPYKVTVTDTLGCVDSLSAVIAEPADSLSLTETHTDVTCAGPTDGAINLTVAGGTSPYIYSWSPGGETTEDLSGLAAGTYTVTVTDDNGCVDSLSVAIIQPNALVLTPTHADVSCFGAGDGTIDLEVTGGTGPYSYLWSPGGATTQDTSGLGPETYKVIVTDMNGCKDSLEIVIAEPAVLVPTEMHTDVTCNGASDGTIDLTVGGGTIPYTYLWSPGAATSQDTSGLDPGTYKVIVKDKNGCQDSLEVVITEPAALALSETHTDVTCFEANDGAIDLTVTGGVTPYGYLWSPGGATTEDPSGLGPDTYTVTVTDDNGCTKSLSVTILEPTELSATETHVDVACYGDSTGSIDVTVSGGTPGATAHVAYTADDVIAAWWVDGGGATPQPLGPNAGDWTRADFATLHVSPGINQMIFEAKNAHPLSPSDSAGFLAEITGVGLTGDLLSDVTWEWADATGGVPVDFNTLTWTPVTSYGSNAPGDPNIWTPVAGIADAAMWIWTANNGTVGGEDHIFLRGTIEATSFRYVWSPNGETTEDLSDLAAGAYDVTVTDANGCTTNLGVTIDQPLAALSLIESHQDALCKGDPMGSIDLDVTGGTPGYTYVWSPNGETTEDLSDLVAGVYKVTVTDAKGCMDTLAVTIAEPLVALMLTETHVDVLGCYGDSTGSIDLTVTGGTGPYDYSWSPGGETSEDLSIIPAGTYEVTVEDQNGCIKTLSTTLTQPAKIVISETHTNVSCNGAADGSIDLTVTGGTPITSASAAQVAYTGDNSVLAWWVVDGGAASQPLGPNAADWTVADVAGLSLLPGPYQVIFEVTNLGPVSVANPAAFLAEISGPAMGGDLLSGTSWEWADASGGVPGDFNTLTWAPVTSYGTNAPGDPNTWANVSGISNAAQWIWTGGTEEHIFVRGQIQKSPYDFSWSPGGEVTEDLFGLAGGTYDVTVTDGNGCTATRSVAITEPDVLALTETHVNVVCKGDSTGSVDLTVAGGTSPYGYLWSPGGETTEDVSTLVAGTYKVMVTDDHGCVDSLSVTLDEPATALSLIATHVDVSCRGAGDGSIDLTVSGGTPGYSYLWMPGSQTTEDLSNLAAGTYTVTVTDTIGCTATKSVVVSRPDALLLTQTHVEVVGCHGDSTGSIDLSVSGGTMPYLYLWTPGGETTEDLAGLGAGTYMVTVTDDHGCEDSLKVTVTEPAALALSATPVDTKCQGTSFGSIDLSVSGGTPGYSYLWSPGAQTTQDISSLTDGAYKVRVTDAHGCMDSLLVTVGALPDSFTIKASAGAGGAIAPLGTLRVACGSSKTFTFTPDPSYVVLDVEVDGFPEGPSPSYPFTDIQDDHTIHVTFDQVVATVVSLFSANPVAGGIELRWRLGDPEALAQVVLDRAETADGPWARVVGTARTEGEVTIVLDEGLTSGVTYLYRLTAITRSGREVTLGEISGTAGERITAFALAPVWPNPARGTANVEFSVPQESRVHLSVLDIQGREIAVIADGSYPAGKYQAVWSGETDRGVAAPSGVYFMHFQSAAGTNLTRRVVLAR